MEVQKAGLLLAKKLRKVADDMDLCADVAILLCFVEA